MLGREMNAYWKTVVETIQEGIMIVDTRGTIVSTNNALERMTGYTSSELVGQSCLILNCDICNAARGLEDNHWCTLFRSGEISMRQCSIERKDGGFTPVLKNATLLRDDQGNVIGAVETLTDISEIVEKDHQIEAFRRALNTEDGFHGILGRSAPMRQVFELIKNAAQTDAPIIVYGESGTGKELVTEAIHAESARSSKPLVKVNCAALTESLLESELFGHVKGAFTGAHASRQGRFEAASGGYIFLDEIGDLPLSTQVKLLRVLEDKVIERVGDNKPIQVDVRIITATNRDLQELVRQGSFRQDLYYRINVVPIHLPPLRERPEDVPLLSEHFFERIKLKTGKPLKGISPEAMEALCRYSWPGNIRELKSVFEYAFVACSQGMIQPNHLLPQIFQKKQSEQSGAGDAPPRDEQIKQELIQALQQAQGNQSEAARLLGVSRVTVWNRMKKYNIQVHNVIEP
ncbi:sigma-54 interaction domain-containing protein [Desulfovermiculus halophilus]|uniref:sigma-54 interaction domain-containing protein n=1 Tax=Desulfovermiculus halophilus TaxID=339722 RepID=UPI00048A1FC3|nr:sigma-54-dependent Fis family transcriptional regulator [Desulfovermiculus halophilus]